jgi:hypothetical protein
MISDLPREPSRVLTGSLSWVAKSPFDDLWSWMSARRAGLQLVACGLALWRIDTDSCQMNCLLKPVSSKLPT